MTLGEYIAQRRKKLHLTQPELNERLQKYGVDRDWTTLANWENGRQPVPTHYIPAIAQALEEPSPNHLYDLAGIVENLNGATIVRLLADASAKDVDRIARMVEAYLENSN